MSHVSTAYVNGDKLGGFISEKIYDYPWDPNETAERLIAMPIETLKKEQTELCKPWPNTYCFTKSLCERNLKKHRGNIPIFICRPSIIISSNNEPVPGWTDSMAAAGPITNFFGVGL